MCAALPGGPAPCETFLEGPAVDAAGDVYFSDEPYDRILRADPASGHVVAWRRPAYRATAWPSIGGAGSLFKGASPWGGRSVARYERDGTRTVLA